MTDSFIYKTERPWPNQRLKIAAIVGHTTASSCRLWFRTGSPGDFQLLLYPEQADPTQRLFESFPQVPYSHLGGLPTTVKKYPFSIPDYRNDTTHVVDLSRLSPDTTYCYALYSNNEKRIILGQDRLHSFRTLPVGDQPFSFSFFSCHMPYSQPRRGNIGIENLDVWHGFEETLRRHQKDDLRFIIASGDQVYVDGIKKLNLWRYLNKTMRKVKGKLLPTKEDMLSWYRDIYRGYWGFDVIKRIYSSYPTYMIWDDHELGDGWGSHKIKKDRKNKELRWLLPAIDNPSRKLKDNDVIDLAMRMGEAGKQAYREYQHSHNPGGALAGQYDYHFQHGSSAFYVLDGRGYRDINRKSYRILGEPQLRRFQQWLGRLNPDDTKFLFVVSAVPVLHARAAIVNMSKTYLVQKLGLADDLRDSWEHKYHKRERTELMQSLFEVADRGIGVSILSGDVHVAAAFKIRKPGTDSVIYQLTSSAITYNIPRALGWVLGSTVPKKGTTDEGYHFQRMALFLSANYALVQVDPDSGEAEFQLYGAQELRPPAEVQASERPVSHSIFGLPLTFR